MVPAQNRWWRVRETIAETAVLGQNGGRAPHNSGSGSGPERWWWCGGNACGECGSRPERRENPMQFWERFSPRTVVMGWRKHLRILRFSARPAGEPEAILGAVLAQNGVGGVAETPAEGDCGSQPEWPENSSKQAVSWRGIAITASLHELLVPPLFCRSSAPRKTEKRHHQTAKSAANQGDDPFHT